MNEKWIILYAEVYHSLSLSVIIGVVSFRNLLEVYQEILVIKSLFDSEYFQRPSIE